MNSRWWCSEKAEEHYMDFDPKFCGNDRVA